MSLAPLIAEIDAVASDPAMPELPFSLFREFGDSGRRLGYERAYFARRAKLVALAAQAVLRPGASVDALSDAMWSVCDEHTWALPAHLPGTVDLFAAETAHTLAETVTALGSRLDARVADRVREQVRRRVFEPFADPTPFPWEGSRNNWEAVCAGAVGMAALALLDDPLPIIGRCRRAMASFLSGYGDDGGCAEGVGYWAYGFGYFVYFAEALGGDLLDSAKVARIAAFPQRVWLGDDAYVPFSDTTERPSLPAGLMSRLHERFGTAPPATVPSFHDDHCYRWAHLSRTLSWYRPAPPAHSSSAVNIFDDLGWVVSRGDRCAFAAKGGHNDEPHNHHDLGHFVLRVDGVNVLDDLGAGEYTREYFGPDRYRALQPSALGHSVPIIDGCTQLSGADRRAVVLRAEPAAEGLVFELDLTQAYAVDGLRSLIRRFDWHQDGRLTVTDELTVDRPVSFEELLISRVDWAAFVTLDHPGLVAHAETLQTTDHFGRPDTVYRTRLTGHAPAGKSVWRLRIAVRPARM
ncbi:heparinase II/III domain-containing protein [Allorhizocola rhizosphaerae]|uniref:heparinase II/III domain-containing protein n=1 Tax=Allorhizocola rhizosphaerae TaxID=1872709 RepID=UPI000E3C8D95|nr:heparinase II/III family protein [Allorhizocola rhizosphaerae]